MLRKEFLHQINFLQVQRKNLLNKKEKVEIDLNRKKFANVPKKKSSEKIQVWEKKLIHNQTEITDLEWDMKNKPIFHKFDSILAIRKKEIISTLP